MNGKKLWGKNRNRQSVGQRLSRKRQQYNITSNKQNNVKSYLFVKSFKHFRNLKYAKNAIISKWNNKQVVLLQPDYSMAYNSCCRLYHEKSKWRKEKLQERNFGIPFLVLSPSPFFRINIQCSDYISNVYRFAFT